MQKSTNTHTQKAEDKHKEGEFKEQISQKISNVGNYFLVQTNKLAKDF